MVEKFNECSYKIVSIRAYLKTKNCRSGEKMRWEMNICHLSESFHWWRLFRNTKTWINLIYPHIFDIFISAFVNSAIFRLEHITHNDDCELRYFSHHEKSFSYEQTLNRFERWFFYKQTKPQKFAAFLGLDQLNWISWTEIIEMNCKNRLKC